MNIMSKLSFLNKFKTMDRNTILVCVAVVAIVITGVLIIANSYHSFSLPNLFGYSDKQIGQKVVDYINSNQLSQTPASLVGVSETSGLVKVKIKIGTNEFDSYATKDGKLLFPQAFDMTPKKTAAAAEQNTNSTQAKAVVKAATPVLEAYVVSSCPYGLQMQRAFADAVKSVPALASDVVIRYIGDVSNGKVESMHGPEEAAENLRQICIRQEQPTKYWSYVSCYMKKTTATAAGGMPLGDSTGCLTSAGVDTAKLNTCVTDPSKGVAYAQKDFSLAAKYSVQGSPTLILNGSQVDESSYGGRSSDAVRAIVCAGSTAVPSFCSKTLNASPAAVSFSTTYASGSGSVSSSANCNTAQ